jgi:hypothetical protein
LDKADEVGLRRLRGGVLAGFALVVHCGQQRTEGYGLV